MDTRNECSGAVDGVKFGAWVSAFRHGPGKFYSVEVVLAARLAAGPIETVAVQQSPSA